MTEGLQVGADVPELMAGIPTPEQARALRKLVWATPVRPLHAMTLGGVGILVASWAYLMFALLSVPLHSGFTTPILAALVLLLIGGGIMVVGAALRGRAIRKIAYRPCSACHTTNLWLSEHCSKCGAVLPVITVT